MDKLCKALVGTGESRTDLQKTGVRDLEGLWVYSTDRCDRRKSPGGKDCWAGRARVCMCVRGWDTREKAVRSLYVNPQRVPRDRMGAPLPFRVLSYDIWICKELGDFILSSRDKNFTFILKLNLKKPDWMRGQQISKALFTTSTCVVPHGTFRPCPHICPCPIQWPEPNSPL